MVSTSVHEQSEKSRLSWVQWQVSYTQKKSKKIFTSVSHHSVMHKNNTKDTHMHMHTQKKKYMKQQTAVPCDPLGCYLQVANMKLIIYIFLSYDNGIIRTNEVPQVKVWQLHAWIYSSDRHRMTALNRCKNEYPRHSRRWGTGAAGVSQQSSSGCIICLHSNDRTNVALSRWLLYLLFWSCSQVKPDFCSLHHTGLSWFPNPHVLWFYGCTAALHPWWQCQ